MVGYKPFRPDDTSTPTEDRNVNIDLDHDITPHITSLKKTLTTKKCIIVRSIQILLTVCILITGIFVWWFSCLVGSAGIVTMLLGIYPYRGNRILVIIASLASLASSVALLCYSNKWNGIDSTKCSILIMVGLAECAISISCIVMASIDSGFSCCVVSPNSSLIYFGRNKLPTQEYPTHCPTTIPSELNVSNYLTKLKNVGSIYRQKDLAKNGGKEDGNAQYYGAHHGPSPPPYLDFNSNTIIFNENINVKGI